MAGPTAPSGSLADLSLPERIAALVAHSRRFGPVFPCYGVISLDGSWKCECGAPACKHRVSKHPHISGWPARATENPLQIEKWCAQYPSANWAIHTTKINVVDLDRKPGKPDGVLTLQSWEDTMNVQTPDGVRVTTGTGIDVRAQGGYVMAPGSRHANGKVYEIDIDEGLEPCPAWLVARISGKIRPNRINRVTIPIHSRGVLVGGAQRFQIRPDAKLSPEAWARINELRSKLPKFASTWSAARATSPWPFAQGRNSPSEYEAAIAFFLVWDGRTEQEIMDTITVWRRQCGLEAPTQYSRYACTLGKAVAMVTPRAKGLGDTRKELKGCWKHGYTRDHILSCIIETPRSARQIAEVTGIDLVNVKVVIGRLRKDGKVIRDNHTYLCAPHAVPGHLQNIPDDADEPTSDELAEEYAEWVAAGMPGLGAVEEEVEAPLGFAPPAAVPCMSTLPDFDELEPELVKVATEPIPAGKHLHFSLAALKREAAEKRRAKGYASRYLPTATDLELERLMTMDRPPIDDSVDPFLE